MVRPPGTVLLVNREYGVRTLCDSRVIKPGRIIATTLVTHREPLGEAVCSRGGTVRD